MPIWNKEIECMPREEMRALQGKRLKTVITKMYAAVPAYRQKMEEAGITPDDINTIDDLQKLPFTYKQDLRDNYPYGMFAVPTSEVVRILRRSKTNLFFVK